MQRAALAPCLLLLLACGSDSHAGSDETDSAADAGRPDAGSSSYPDANTIGDATLCSTCGACEETLRIGSALHKPEPIDYEQLPPAGGDHSNCWTSFGVHEQEVPDERWVHNLEHGAVVFLHHCADGCAAEREQLEALSTGRPFALVLPYAALPTRFAALAWGQRLLSDCFDADVFQRFYEAHVDRAIESGTFPPSPDCLK